MVAGYVFATAATAQTRLDNCSYTPTHPDPAPAPAAATPNAAPTTVPPSILSLQVDPSLPFLTPATGLEALPGKVSPIVSSLLASIRALSPGISSRRHCYYRRDARLLPRPILVQPRQISRESPRASLTYRNSIRGALTLTSTEGEGNRTSGRICNRRRGGGGGEVEGIGGRGGGEGR